MSPEDTIDPRSATLPLVALGPDSIDRLRRPVDDAALRRACRRLLQFAAGAPHVTLGRDGLHLSAIREAMEEDAP